jgi:ParB family chromosome partitioning protein
MTKMHIEAIQVADRHRRDLGNLDALAKSLADVGLINPITVTEAGRLIAGQRRLEAARLLGWTEIEVRVALDLRDAAERLRTERDENTERKAMTPEELVRLGRELEKLERPTARARQGTRRDLGIQLCDPQNTKLEKTREVVAGALGMSPMSYHRARAVVGAADNPAATPEDRAVAQAALAEMNATGRIVPSYDKVRRTRDVRLGPNRKTTITDAGGQRKAIPSAIVGLSGIAHGLARIQDIHPDITSDEAAQWVDGLSDARRTITGLIQRLKERSNGQT